MCECDQCNDENYDVEPPPCPVCRTQLDCVLTGTDRCGSQVGDWEYRCGCGFKRDVVIYNAEIRAQREKGGAS